MLEIPIPGRDRLCLQHLVLDVNGTLALDGILLPGIVERLATLRELLEIHLITADTHGTQRDIDRQLGLTATRLSASEAGAPRKAAYVEQLGGASVAAIGNGVNDVLMLRAAALGIAVVGPEGLAVAALREADVVIRTIHDALDLLLHPRRLSATLRA